MIKIYQRYLILNFLKKFLIVSLIFLTLIFILGLLEEISFFKNYNNHNPLYPYFFSILNAPITLFEIFPFIFIITTLFFFHEIFHKDELNLLKKSGLNNLSIIKILFFISIIIGLFNIIIFYNISSTLRFHYLNIKNNLTSDNKYLAMVTNNGIWIKDELNNKKLIIKSNFLIDNFLTETIINEFDDNFKLLKTIRSKKIDISNNEWIIFEPIITSKNLTKKEQTLLLQTNFNEKKIKNLFSDISALNLIKLLKLRENYNNVGYSPNEITIYLLKTISMPLLYGILTILSSIMIFNLSNNKGLFFQIILGIFISVLIYYVNFIFNSLGNNGKLPSQLAIFFPYLIYSIISIIGLVRVNEK